MRMIYGLLQTILRTMSALWEAAGYIFTFLGAFLSPRATLAARVVAAESQLAMYKRRIEQKNQPRPRFTQVFRLLWVLLSRLWDQWHQMAHLMQPATVKRWHTRAFRLYWRWKSRRRPGRPPVAKEMRDLIRKLSRENPVWSAERIRDTLRLLGCDPPSSDTIRRYMVHPKTPPDKPTTWLVFLRNHLEVSWAMDFFTVVTTNFSFLYVFVVFEHGRRRVIHFATTYHPSMEWVIQQLREATPFGRQPRFVFRDNDGIYGHGVGAFLKGSGIEEVRTAYRSPWQNPYSERFFGTLRRELLDHVIVLNERHLNRLLREYIEQYYHANRPHQGLKGDTPVSTKKPDVVDGSIKLISFPVCGGLHHRYERVAA
jgi:transposase InsO family protein